MSMSKSKVSLINQGEKVSQTKNFALLIRLVNKIKHKALELNG